jgi:hypothetical protein
MKNRFFNTKFALLLSALFLACSGLPSKAATATYTLIKAGTVMTNLVPAGARITAISIAHPATTSTNLVWRLVDAPVLDPDINFGPAGITNTGYMTVGSYTTNITLVHTNFGGVKTTNELGPFLWTYTNFISGDIAAWRSIIPTTSTASNTVSSSVTLPDDGIVTAWGISITNNAVAGSGTPSITITYTPNL